MKPHTPTQFVQAWKGRNLTERASSQTHFRQLCELLGVPAPFDDRTQDDDYCFDAITATAGSKVYAAASKGAKGAKARQSEGPGLFGQDHSEAAEDADDGSPPLSRIVSASGDSHGFADVWKRGCFCWEYKRQGKHANLAAALAQLKQYRDSLDNPPLLIVCDVDHFEIHTNWTGYPAEVYRFTLEDLADPPDEWSKVRGISPLNALRKAFDPDQVEWFKPKKSVNAITEELAGRFADLAKQIRERKRPDGQTYDPHQIAHFLMQVVFCLFAEDTDLLPHDLFTEIVQSNTANPAGFIEMVRDLFERMESGGHFGVKPIEHFNGGLFRGVRKQAIPALLSTEIGTLSIIARADWTAIEPSILGTLFERALDPDKRAQIGAHYTSREDIMLIIEPVILEPLRVEWCEIQVEVGKLIGKRDRAKSDAARDKAQATITERVRAFGKKLSTLRILDPACGSGNFLYVAIQCLLDLEKEVMAFGARPEVGVKLRSKVKPTQLFGIEINTYAAELARVSIWIGYLKWRRENGLQDKKRPILDALDTIENRDAILEWKDANSTPIAVWTEGAKCHGPAKWPRVDYIIGNPPFLGTKMLRGGLGDEYVEALFASYKGRIPGFSDLVCYWFELAREQIERHDQVRAGLLATQAIRNGEARTVLERIKQTGDIFMAWSDRLWLLDGAAVQVSMIGFGGEEPTVRRLNGAPVDAINADLTSGADITSVDRLKENQGIAFVGDVKGGPFDIDLGMALSMLADPTPNGRSAAEVVRPYTNGLDITRRNRAVWVVDFGSDMSQSAAAGYGSAFDHVARFVKPMREKGRPTRSEWWLHMRPCPSMREAVEPLPRYLATPTLTKHRLFVWMSGRTLPDHQLVVFSRSDDYFFGVLQSAIHGRWSLCQGTQLENRPRYTPTSTFETFPLPWIPGDEPTAVNDPHYPLWHSISEAATELDRLREGWLNPPKWITPVEKQVDLKYRADLDEVPDDIRPLVRQSAIMAEAAQDKRLKKLTLTNLYNERPAWLRLAHEKLDRAVLAAYAATDPEGDWNPDWAKVYEPFGAGEITIKESGRGADSPEEAERKREAIAAREPIDQRILANLLRLNHARASVHG